MIICGVEFKASSIVFAVVQLVDDETEVVEQDIKQLRLNDSESSAEIREIRQCLSNFAKEAKIDVFVIRKRNTKGQFSGGPDSFKLEGLLQSIESANIEFIHPATVSASEKKKPILIPSGILKYQHEAYKVAVVYTRKVSA